MDYGALVILLLSSLVTTEAKISASKGFLTAAPAIGNWLAWSTWSQCTESVYCLQGSRRRWRDCEEGKRCVGIEAESEDCPETSCSQDRAIFQDALYVDDHSFIQEECLKSVKYHVRGTYASKLKHNVSKLFPQARDFIEESFFNMKFTKKELKSEENIFKYCFEPGNKSLSLNEFASMFSTESLRYKYTTIFRPLPKRDEAKYVTGYVIGVQELGELYAIYAQVTTTKGFHSIYYKRMPGYNLAIRRLIW